MYIAAFVIEMSHEFAMGNSSNTVSKFIEFDDEKGEYPSCSTLINQSFGDFISDSYSCHIRKMTIVKSIVVFIKNSVLQ